jgi:hypothetical protein
VKERGIKNGGKREKIEGIKRRGKMRNRTETGRIGRRRNGNKEWEGREGRDEKKKKKVEDGTNKEGESEEEKKKNVKDGKRRRRKGGRWSKDAAVRKEEGKKGKVGRRGKHGARKSWGRIGSKERRRQMKGTWKGEGDRTEEDVKQIMKLEDDGGWDGGGG